MRSDITVNLALVIKLLSQPSETLISFYFWLD